MYKIRYITYKAFENVVFFESIQEAINCVNGLEKLKHVSEVSYEKC